MDIERAKGILKEACMNYTEFSKLMGVKPITVRLAFSGKRLSKKMVAKLESMEVPQVEEKEKSEGMIKQSMNDVRSAKVYALVRNPFLRLVEFTDGTHGKFRAKPGRFGLGSVVKLKRGEGEMWDLVGDYDKKDRLV